MGIVSKVISTVRKIDGIYTMMEDAVKKIDEVYIFVEGKRHLVFPESTLIFEKTTAGEYEFTVPEKYNYVMVEYAGAQGGRAWNSDGGGIYSSGNGGKGSIKQEKIKLNTRNITGIVGATPTKTYESEYLGGIGYSNGEKSNKQSVTVKYVSGGGGGGSTSIVVNSVVYEASAGGGASQVTMLFSNVYGGKGGGKYGGARQNANDANGNNATDPNQVGLNSGNGYVRIYGIAG